MSAFSKLFSGFEAAVKIEPWLQFVGYMLSFGGLIARAHWFGIPLAFVGLGVSMAGFDYEKIYP